MSSDAALRTRSVIERVRALARERRVNHQRPSRRPFVVDQARGRRLAAARVAAQQLDSHRD